MEKRKCKSSWGWRAHRPPMTLLRTEGTVAYIGGSDTLPAPLSREEEQALFLNMEAQPETARRTIFAPSTCSCDRATGPTCLPSAAVPVI